MEITSLSPEEQELAETMTTEVSRDYHKERDAGDKDPSLYSKILMEVITSHGIEGSDAISRFRSAIATVRAQRSKKWKERETGQ